MKRIAVLFLAALLALAGCSGGNTANTIKDDKTLADVIAAVDAKFAETYGEDCASVMMPMQIDSAYLTDFCGIDTADIEDFAGAVSMSMTNSDAFFGVKAKEGSADTVKAALEKRLGDIVAQYEIYPVNGSYERAQAGEVYQKGDYLFLIVVGIMTDMDAAPEFDKDVSMTKEVIDSMFN